MRAARFCTVLFMNSKCSRLCHPLLTRCVTGCLSSTGSPTLLHNYNNRLPSVSLFVCVSYCQRTKTNMVSSWRTIVRWPQPFTHWRLPFFSLLNLYSLELTHAAEKRYTTLYVVDIIMLSCWWHIMEPERLEMVVGRNIRRACTGLYVCSK